MQSSAQRVHTTLNLSKPLMSKARKLFKDKTQTDIIHEAVERLVQAEMLARHVKKWSGKVKVHDYE